MSASGGMLYRGFEEHRAVLMQAQNLGQLDAMKRQLSRGEQIQWCDQSYGWTYQSRVDAMFDAILVAVILPWFVWRVLRPALRWSQARFSGPRAALKISR